MVIVDFFFDLVRRDNVAPGIMDLRTAKACKHRTVFSKIISEMPVPSNWKFYG